MNDKLNLKAALNLEMQGMSSDEKIEYLENKLNEVRRNSLKSSQMTKVSSKKDIDELDLEDEGLSNVENRMSAQERGHHMVMQIWHEIQQGYTESYQDRYKKMQDTGIGLDLLEKTLAEQRKKRQAGCLVGKYEANATGFETKVAVEEVSTEISSEDLNRVYVQANKFEEIQIGSAVMDQEPETARKRVGMRGGASTEILSRRDKQRIREMQESRTDNDTSDERAAKKTEAEDKHEISKGIKGVLSFIFDITVPAIICYILLAFVFLIVCVPTESMVPTIEPRSILLGSRIFDEQKLESGDIIVFRVDEPMPGLESPESLIVKRIIGTGGDTVTIMDNCVYLNGIALDESYLPNECTYFDGQWTVPEGSFFMMGDNRDYSYDSRYWENPFVPSENIIGKIFVISPSVDGVGEVLNGILEKL